MKRSFQKISFLYLIVLIFAIYIIAFPIMREIKFNKYNIEQLNYNDYDFFLEYHKKVQINSIYIAEQALYDIYHLNYEHLEFSPLAKQLDDLWQNSKIFDSNSHEFYAHSLSILWHLMIAHQQTQNSEFLFKGREIIISWINSNKRFDPDLSNYAWGDHSTAKRSIVILFFLDYYKKYAEIDDEFANLVKKNINSALHFLSNSSNYTFPHNHGIYQDIALYFIACHLEKPSIRDKYQNLAIKRFQKQIKNSFSENGFHLENSPGYHFLTLQKCSEFVALLNDKSGLDTDIIQLIELAENNKEILHIGDNFIPPIGDTEMLRDIDVILPDKSFFSVDSLAGYLHYRSPSHTLHVRANGISKTHSHNDAFSFIYSDEDRIIFTEAGFLNFSDSGDRKFTLSLQAHNTFLPIKLLDDFETNYQSKISEYANNDQILYCKIDSQNIASVSRILLLDKLSDCLFIIDEFKTKKYQEWIRLFNLHNTLDIIESNTKEIKLKSNDDVFYIQSYSNSLNTVHGSEKPKLGWNSNSIQELEPAYTIVQYTSDEKNLVSLSKNNSVDIIKFEDQELNFLKSGELRSIKRFDDCLIVDNDSLRIEKYQVLPNDVVSRKNLLSFKRRFQLIILYVILLCLTLLAFNLLKYNMILKILMHSVLIVFICLSLFISIYLIIFYQF